MSKLKEFLTQPLFKTESAHAGVQAVAGAYVIYLAYTMVQTTLDGDSTLSMTWSVILAGLMALAGLGIIIYAFRKLWADWKRRQAAEENAEE